MMCNYTFFSKDPSQWDEAYQSLWGCHDICSILEQFHIAQVTQPEFSSLTHLLVWGDPKRFCSDVAFLLILPKEGISGERVYGLAMVWVHPYQARVSTIDDTVRKLTLLASAGLNWPYMFVQFNGDAHHMPLPKEGHSSAMVEGTPSNILCRRICQLEVHQLLHSEAQVVYPKGLNRVFGSGKNHSAKITVRWHNYTQWWAYLPTSGHLTIHNGWTWVQDPFLSGGFKLYFPTHPATVPSPKAESCQHDHGGLWTPITGGSGHLWSSIGVFHPQKTSVPGLRSTTLSQATKFCQTSGHLLSGVPTGEHSRQCQTRQSDHWRDFSSSQTSGLGAGILPGDVVQLQEEAGKVLGCLLVTRSSLNAHWRKQVSDFEMAFCQNESETTKAIKEAKTLCTCTTRIPEAHRVMLISKAEAQHATCIMEAKANCASIIAEVENCCSMMIRKAESCSVKQAHSIQQSHAKGMQHLETEAIGEEGKDCLSFLTTCGAILQASHPKDHGVLVTPFHLLLGKCTLVYSTKYSPQYLPFNTYLPHHFLILLSPWHWGPSPIQMVTPPSRTVSPPLSETTPRVAPEEPPHSKRRDEMPLHKALTGDWQEAFTRDSDLVQKAREEHYKMNCPHFDHETSHDPTNIFWDMIESTGLLGSQIYEIQEFWEGWSELRYANNVLSALPKGLQFFHPVSPSESPKVMGLQAFITQRHIIISTVWPFVPGAERRDRMIGL